jgi:hypothetical protein
VNILHYNILKKKISYLDPQCCLFEQKVVTGGRGVSVYLATVSIVCNKAIEKIGPVGQAKCLTIIHCNKNPIYIFLFCEFCGLIPNFNFHVSVSDIYVCIFPESIHTFPAAE